MLEELERFKKFKNNYDYKCMESILKDGIEYIDEEPLVVDGEKVGESDKWINVGYKNSGSLSKLLSNLFPYEFEFRGLKLQSIEAFFQGIKFKDINMQKLVFNYSGLDANRIKACCDNDWKKDGILYFQGKQLKRNSKEYSDLVDELYISAIQNPLYRNALLNCNKTIIHSIGNEDINDTVFTRFEFEKELNCLKDFLKSNNL